MASVETTVNGEVKETTYAYDQYNNVSDKSEYDWGSGSAGPLLRETQTNYAWVALPAFAGSSVNLTSLPLDQWIYDGGKHQAVYTGWRYDEQAPNDVPGIVGHDSSYGPTSNTRGNLTTENHALGSGIVTTLRTYDIAGNVLTETDPNGNKTTYSYSDSQNTYAHATTITNALNQSRTFAYDYNTGKPTAVGDWNPGVVASYAYSDPLDRLTQVRRATNLGSSVESQTNYQYFLNPIWVSTGQDQNTTGDGAH
jgi:YD repeat-containing protein